MPSKQKIKGTDFEYKVRNAFLNEDIKCKRAY